MSEQSILASLLEVFPQIGYGTLKDIGIAYVDDIDAAAEFVLHDLLSNTNAFDVGWDDADTTEVLSAEGMQSFDHFVGGYGVEQSQCSSSEKKLACSASDDDLKSVHENDLPAITTRSSHSVSIESLDDAIADEKNNKNTLLSSVASVSNMLEQVELHEATAKQAKSEASNAVHDILVKVEELKEMSKHARQENDTYAGEVFGEKSILATETQELQTRLHTVSEERNKSLSIIQEVCSNFNHHSCKSSGMQ